MVFTYMKVVVAGCCQQKRVPSFLFSQCDGNGHLVPLPPALSLNIQPVRFQRGFSAVSARFQRGFGAMGSCDPLGGAGLFLVIRGHVIFLECGASGAAPFQWNLSDQWKQLPQCRSSAAPVPPQCRFGARVATVGMISLPPDLYDRPIQLET